MGSQPNASKDSQEQMHGDRHGEPRDETPLRLAVLLFLSAGSGAAALVYEVVWFQMLELAIGSTAISLAVILTAFMGGMGIGSLLFPRLVHDPFRWNPLRIYAAIEGGIGALGVFVLFAIPLVGSLYTEWESSGTFSLLLRGLVAAVCLALPAMLMGATLPALSRVVTEREGPTMAGVSWIGWLYTANLIGAVAGCCLAGFYLLREFDVATATYFAVGANFLIAAGAIAASPFFGAAIGIRPEAKESRQSEIQQSSDASGDRLVYLAIGLSGLCALAGETIWTRTLGLLFGASTYTFSIILAVFLTGLGMGSGLGSLLCRTVDRPRVALGWCQILAAGAIAWSAYNIGSSLPFWPINPLLASDIWFNFQIDLARAFWTLLPSTLFWGASFPLAMAAMRPNQAVEWEGELEVARRSDSASLVARVYVANTTGAIIGALTASLLLVPWLGSQGAQQVMIGLSFLAGIPLIIDSQNVGSQNVGSRLRWPELMTILGTTAATGFLLWSVPPIAPLLIAHGRYAATWVNRGEVLYAVEGLNSSVAVMSFPNGSRTFHVAGKIQASDVSRDLRLQRMLGHLTTLTAANPKSVLVIGCGAGVTAGAVSIDPRVERETIVEIEPLVPEAAAAYFSQANFGVIHNPNVDVRIDDGRHFLMTSREHYDAITMDPLDPWAKGAASLYTQEFLESMKQHLNPGGTATVYVQLFETNDDAVRSLLATFFQVFPEATVWGNPYAGEGYDMVLLGTKGPLHIDLEAIERRLESSEFALVSQSMAEVGIAGALDLFANYAGQAPHLNDWIEGAEINRDRNLRMQYLAGFGLNLDNSASIYADILRYRRFPEDLFEGSNQQIQQLRRRMRP